MVDGPFLTILFKRVRCQFLDSLEEGLTAFIAKHDKAAVIPMTFRRKNAVQKLDGF